MTLQAYFDTIKVKTGKTPEDFRRLAEKNGLLRPGVKTGQIVAWLNKDFGLGRGHAMAIALTFRQATQPEVTTDEGIADHFKGDRARWRKSYEQLVASVGAFGPGVSVAPTASYLNIIHDGKKFAILQITRDRLDVGIKLKGEAPDARFEAAGAWNSMVTHSVRISEPKQIDRQVLTRLKRAFDRS
jgi:hypothetical protein